MEFWRYYRIIRRRRWLILLGIIVSVGFVAYHNKTLKPMYVAKTTLMESKGMAQQGTPLFQDIYRVQQTADVQLQLSNLGQIATSQRVLQDAAKMLEDYNITVTPDMILKNTQVKPEKDTNILGIYVTLENPEDARIAAEVVATAFKRAYNELNNAAVRQSREFIEAQIESTRLAMEKAQNELRKFKEENELIMLDQQSISAIQRMANIKTTIDSTTATLQAAAAKVRSAERELRGIPEFEESLKHVSRNPVWQSLTEELNRLETKRANEMGGPGKTGKGPNHPDILALDRSIEEVKQKMKSESVEYTSQRTTSKNPTYSQALERYIVAKVEEAGTNAQLAALKAVEVNTKAELASLPAKEAKMAQLDADLQAAKNTYSLMKNKLDEAKIREDQAQNELALRTIDSAFVTRVNQKQSLKLILALILSPILGIGVAFLLHYTDNTIRTAQDAEKLLELPILSEIPRARAHSLPRQKCPEVLNVAHQMLTSNLWIASQDNGLNAITIVSAQPDSGRSVTASNLAVALAKEGAKVILVDSDLRKSSQHSIFDVSNNIGLSNLLSGGAVLEDVIIPTKIEGLVLIPAGPIPDNPVKLLRSDEMQDFCDQIREVADFVVFDTPAGVAFPDPILVSAKIGAALMVQAAGKVSRGSEVDLRNKLQSIGVNVVGVVLTQVKREDSSGYFHYHRSYSGIPSASLPSKTSA